MLLAASPPLAPEETLTNDTVVALTGAGLGDEAIIAKIRSSKVQFSLTTDDLIALKQKNVSGPVIAAMISAASGNGGGTAAPALSMDSPDPAVPHPSGVYLLAADAEGARMRRIDPTVSSQAKTGGIFGYALTGGLASMSVKASIANETARVQTGEKQPKFYFFFDESNAATGAPSGTWLAGTAATVTSPNEFSLVRLVRKKGTREARVGSMNIAGSKVGVMDKDRIGFDYRMVRPGVFEVVILQPLAPGEYGFLYSVGGANAGGALTARIFDFTVK
ncbi:hypothetical protein [Sphingomonas sp.]|uniref:hypothetical protein n=1 Tax=Sphingomonas sp. TaxID=28214 RepID=UPI001B087A54|nr:hypothetical protein [Sphingomonas sp.]MBO9712863.1 hypothetical protein [Sphingomonas sp.]